MQELRAFLVQHPSWTSSTQTSSMGLAQAEGEAQSSQLLSQMVSALLKCCDTEVGLMTASMCCCSAGSKPCDVYVDR